MKRKPVFFLCVLISLFSINILATEVFADKHELDEITKAVKQKRARWVSGQTSVSGLTKHERQRRLGSQRPEVTGKERALVLPPVQLPDKLDWRNYNGNNYVTPVKEQGSCGACWAFAPTAALESNFLISKNTPGIDLDLSEQTLISCGFSGSCEGGYIDAASDFISTIGLPPESCYPFGAQEGFCSDACPDWTENTYKMNGWFKVNPTVESIKYALYNLGPLVTIISAQTDFFYYKSGIYSHSWGSFEGYHSALIVGYDDVDQCFIVKSSWGKDWGEDGYSRIAYSEVNSETQFGLWTIAYETVFPVDFPVIDDIPRSTDIESGRDNQESVELSTLTGTVMDKSGDPVGDARIKLNRYTVNTDSSGKYYFSQIPARNYVVTVSKEGYSTLVENVSLMPDGIINKDFVIQPSASSSSSEVMGGSDAKSEEFPLAGDTPAFSDLGFNYDEQQSGGGLVGETIRILNGNVLEYRNDLQLSSPNKTGLSFTAFYNSQSDATGALGYGWTHTYEASLDPSYQFNSQNYIKIVDDTGAGRFFEEISPGVYQAAFNERSTLAYASGEYIWHRNEGSQYTFNSAGKLIRITDEKSNTLEISYNANNLVSEVLNTSSGRTLTFSYNANNLLESITGPTTTAVANGIWVQYGYDANANLISVIYADGSGFNYAYADPNDIHNLTGKRNKSNHLLNTWSYDASDRAINNFSVNGTGVSVVYASDTQVDVTDAYGILRTYTISEAGGRKRVTAMSGIAEAPYSTNNIISWDYDANMNLVQTGDAGGIINLYQNYDARGNPATVVLASGALEQRTIYYTYHPGMNVPLTRMEASVPGSGNKVTIWDYDDDYNSTPNQNPTGNLCRIIEQGFTADNIGATVSYEYITKITYNGKGQVLSIDGPLAGTADTSTFVYNLSSGDLESITRPLVGSSLFQNYDNAGQVGQTTDVNGHVTTYTYDGRGKVTDVYHAADSSMASLSYNTSGFIASRTDEDSINTGYTYDTTYGRLHRVTDHQNNYIEHLYDTQGNLTDKSYYSADNTKTNWKRFDYQHPVVPGKLYREIKHNDSFMEYAYDQKGNVSAVTDFNGKTTSYEYDALNRLKKVTQPANLITLYSYDGHGNLASVTDARSQITTYLYDDMGRLVQTVSPDTGTVKYSYDEAGNLKQKEDAKGVIVQYDYDNLYRLTTVHFPDSSQDITYAYDQGTNAIGFMSGMTDQSGTTSFGYDTRGRLAGKTATVSGQAYPVSRIYTPGSRVSSLTYPTGRTIDYHRTSCACSVDSVTTTFGANTQTIMGNLFYRPFGGASAMNNGAGGTVGSQYDLSGRLVVSNPGAEHEMTYGYDNNGNLTSINAPSTPWYNRVNETPTTYTYYPGTNRLYQAITATETKNYFYDANGNITDIGNRVLTYNQNNRLVSITQGGSTLGEYSYNGLGQRIIKTAGGVTTVFHYDFDGNIIGESDTSGGFSKEYLYRGSNRLVLVDVGTGSLYYYGNDQLGTPHILTDSTNTVVWEAVYAPYGEADINPNSTVVNNFRLPGQYYDQEAGLHYNWFRYYDPNTGRYLTSDPIGLDSGINLYTYTKNNPINYTDPSGLLTVHIWRYRGKNTAWGHVSMTLEDGTHISWWPSNVRNYSLVIPQLYTAIANDSQTYSDDVLLEGQNPDEQIGIYCLDESTIKDWWLKFKASKKWKTLSQNCSTTVAEGLKIGEAKVSWYDINTKWNIVWKPNDVESFARAIEEYEKKNMEN